MTTLFTFFRFPGLFPRIKVTVGDTIVTARVVPHKNITVCTAGVILRARVVFPGDSCSDLRRLGCVLDIPARSCRTYYARASNPEE